MCTDFYGIDIESEVVTLFGRMTYRKNELLMIDETGIVEEIEKRHWIAVIRDYPKLPTI
jgi:hypothetical protein